MLYKEKSSNEGIGFSHIEKNPNKYLVYIILIAVCSIFVVGFLGDSVSNQMTGMTKGSTDLQGVKHAGASNTRL